MTLRVSGKNMDIGDALREHIEARIDATLEKYRAGPAAGHVTIEREGSGFRADCTLHLKSGATVQADSQAHEPYASFNRAADFIENQVRRHRERLLNHHVSAAAEGRRGTTCASASYSGRRSCAGAKRSAGTASGSDRRIVTAV